MKPNDSRRDFPANTPQKPRVLGPLIFGSVVLHLSVWWAIAQFPAPSAKAPEALIEVQLSDLSAMPTIVPKPQATPTQRETPLLAKAPDKPRRAETPTPNLPRPERRETAPTAPRVRSTRAISETGIVAQKPVATPLVPLASAESQAQNLVARPQRAPDKMPPRIQKPTPATETQSADLSLSAESERQKPGINGKIAGQGSTNGSGKSKARKPVTETGKGSGGGPFGLSGGPFGIGKGPRPGQAPSGKSSPLPTAGGGRGKGSEKSRILGAGIGSGAGNASGAGAKKGASGGPFGIGGAAGEGPRHIVYILDVSYSMEPRFERAKRELRDALGGLRAGESFNIIAFYGNTRPFETRLVEATPRNIAEGWAFVDSLRLGRYTDLERAFETAFAAPGVNVIVLITDGVPTYGLGSPDFSASDAPVINANFGALARRVRELNSAGARIYTVGLTGKKPDGTPDSFEAAELLQRIAADSGGTYATVRVDATSQPD